MSEEVIKMPNSIGQMDPFTEAAKAGELELALSILDTEIEQRLSKFGAADLERKKADEGYYEAKTFRFNIAKGGGTWDQCRRACGWNPDEPAEAKPAGPVVMRVEDLQKGDEIEMGDMLRFVRVDSEGDFQFTCPFGCKKKWLSLSATHSLIARGVEVYRTIDGVRTLISGWPADKHPAVEEAARLREENAKLKNEIGCWKIATECGGGEKNQCESYGELSERFDDLESLIEQQKAEIERLKAAADEPELDESRVIQTFYDLAKYSNASLCHHSWAALISIIKSMFDGAPQFKPYKLKK